VFIRCVRQSGGRLHCINGDGTRGTIELLPL
jgi:hypothetical protein